MILFMDEEKLMSLDLSNSKAENVLEFFVKGDREKTDSVLIDDVRFEVFASKDLPVWPENSQLEITDLKTDSFTLTWPKADQATYYELYQDGELLEDKVVDNSYTVRN